MFLCNSEFFNKFLVFGTLAAKQSKLYKETKLLLTLTDTTRVITTHVPLSCSTTYLELLVREAAGVEGLAHEHDEVQPVVSPPGSQAAATLTPRLHEHHPQLRKRDETVSQLCARRRAVYQTAGLLVVL